MRLHHSMIAASPPSMLAGCHYISTATLGDFPPARIAEKRHYTGRVGPGNFTPSLKPFYKANFSEGKQATSSAIALGRVFSAVAGFIIEVENRGEKMSTITQPDFEIPEYSFESRTSE